MATVQAKRCQAFPMDDAVSNGSLPSTLLVLDFDHTVVDENTDMVIQGLAEGGRVPDAMHSKIKTHGFTAFMQDVFSLLYEQGRREADLKACMEGLLLAPGMHALFAAARRTRTETIVVSDSNTLFIDWILRQHALSDVVAAVYSNPARLDDDGRLCVRVFHWQDECQLSARNLCKGRVVAEHLAKRRADGKQLQRVVVVGDGRNDFCPATRLRASDVVAARRGYALAKLLEGGDERVKAKVVIYGSADELVEHLQP